MCASVCAHAASGLSQNGLPGPYPRTAEEQAAAAKKYNLRPEDYQPYADDGRGSVTHTPTPPIKSMTRTRPSCTWCTTQPTYITDLAHIKRVVRS